MPVCTALSSGKPATSQVAHDLLQYTQLGEQAAAKFITDRLQECTTKFHSPMKKLRLKSFQSMAVKRTLTTTQKKVVHVTAERNVLGQLLMLAKRNDVSFEKLFKFPLGPVPLPLATTDSSFIKTNKAQLLHLLEDQCTPQEQEYPEECRLWTAMRCCSQWFICLRRSAHWRELCSTACRKLVLSIS